MARGGLLLRVTVADGVCDYGSSDKAAPTLRRRLAWRSVHRRLRRGIHSEPTGADARVCAGGQGVLQPAAVGRGWA